jgi:hypothetical protein
MPVTKTTRECYEVRDGQRGGEWANITLACWDRMANVGTKHEGIYYCGEITIQSSFGTWGYIWTACANPFKEFLAGAEFDYVFTKFMGTKLDRFDGDASVREVCKWITEGRRDGSLSKSEAREAWDALEDVRSVAEYGEHEFGTAMMDVARSLDDRHPLHDHFADPCGWPRCTKYDAQAQGFWRQLWPLFIEALKAEAEQPALQAA